MNGPGYDPVKHYSRYEVAGLIVFALVFAFWLLHRTVDHDRNIRDYSGIANVLSSDAGGYYAYLPGFFIYDFQEPPADVVYNKDGFRYVNGRLESKYPVGTALAHSPFFLIAHVFADTKDGYTKPYHLAVRIAGITYAFFGLMCCFFIFRRRTNTVISLLLCLLMFFATHLLYYTLREPGYSHVVSFFLIAFFLLLIDPLAKRSIVRAWLVLPVLTLIVLVRPIDGVVLLPALWWNGNLKSQWNSVCNLIRKNRVAFACALLLSLGLLGIQLSYSLYAAGSLTGTIYRGESFTNIFTPRFARVLVGTYSGLLLYTPVFLLLIITMIWRSFTDFASHRFQIASAFIALYVYAAWSAPDLGCSFSHRGQVDFLAIWFLPFVMFIQQLRIQKRRWMGTAIILFCAACLLYTHVMGVNWWFCSYAGTPFDYAWFWNEVCTSFGKTFG